MASDPTEYLDLPKKNDPRRSVATEDRLKKIRRVAPRVMMQVRRPGWRRLVRSYLRELLEVVNGTGRRISAIRQLRVRDLRLKPTKFAPHGGIVWPADTDKRKKAWRAFLRRSYCGGRLHS